MPNLALYNGNLFTQHPAYPHATAVAIRDGRVWAVGSDEQIRALARPDARVIDLEGRRVLPGLTDAHFHYYDWALGRRRLTLAGAISLADVRERLAQKGERDASRPLDPGPGLERDPLARAAHACPRRPGRRSPRSPRRVVAQ